MAIKIISFDPKTGETTTTIIGSAQAAKSYIKTLKGCLVMYDNVATDAPVVEVKVCPEGTAEAQKAATEAFYKPIKDARRGTILREESPLTAEQEAEQMMEHFAESRAAGMSTEDACRDWDFVQGRS